MKKILAVILASVMTLSLCACSNAKTGDKKTFTVGFDAEFPPYGYMDEAGNYVGFDLDLAQEVCNRRGWELVKQPIDWDAKDMELSSGSIDCIWNGFTINGREDDYTFSVPYVDNSQVYVVKSGSDIKSEADLAGNLVQFADYNTGFMNLESGAIDVLAMDIGVANYEIAGRNGGYEILADQLATEQYGIGFLKGNTELRDQVEATLLEMAADGTVNKIAEKYEDFGLVESLCLEGTKSDK